MATLKELYEKYEKLNLKPENGKVVIHKETKQKNLDDKPHGELFEVYNLAKIIDCNSNKSKIKFYFHHSIHDVENNEFVVLPDEIVKSLLDDQNYRYEEEIKISD